MTSSGEQRVTACGLSAAAVMRQSDHDHPQTDQVRTSRRTGGARSTTPIPQPALRTFSGFRQHGPVVIVAASSQACRVVTGQQLWVLVSVAADYEILSVSWLRAVGGRHCVAGRSTRLAGLPAVSARLG